MELAGAELREGRFLRSRQVRGWIMLLRQYYRIKEITETCGRIATIRRRKAISHTNLVIATLHIYSNLVGMIPKPCTQKIRISNV
jgi:hypothetical protein